MFNFLKKNIEANNCTNVELIEKAVHNKSDEIVYFPPLDMNHEVLYSGNSIVLEKIADGTAVKTITIDSLNINEPVSFMKIDIEGADLFALQGARETIMKNRMPIIFEFSQHLQDDFGTNFGEYVNFVNSINYKFQEIILKINFLILPNEYKA